MSELMSTRKVLAALIVLCMIAVSTAWSPTAAQAVSPLSCSRDNFMPTSGQIETIRNGDNYEATFRFKFTTAQLIELTCFARYVEFDFKLYGFSVPANWDEYSIKKTNIPGAEHDVAAFDPPNEPSPAVTNVRSDFLVAGYPYYATLQWEAALSGSEPPSVSFTVTPSYWATPWVPSEWLLCRAHFGHPGWCIFGSRMPEGQARITGILGPNTTGLPVGKLRFAGYQKHSFGNWDANETNWDSSAPQPLYRGYVPDGMIVQNTSGSNLYSAAGGRLFWFDQNNAPLREALLTQRRAKYGEIPFLVMADEDIHAVEVNRTSTGAYSPGSHMPADNTFMYEYGTTQQYVIKYQHPFAVGDSNEVIALGGQDRAVMVPPGLADLQTHPAQWVQDDLLRFGTDPSVWHFVGQGYRVPSVPTRDCLSVRHNRGVTYMPASAWNYFPTHPTQQAACDFANDQWLFGAPSNRQMVVMYGAGYNVGSAEEVIALGGQNKAVPVADETVTGLLARTGSLPSDELVKSYDSPHVYHVVDNKLHYVGSPATRDCLSARSGKTVRTVPIDLIGRMQANGQTGANAYCELENRQLLAPNGVTVGYVQDGYRRPVTNPNIRNCIAVRTGAGQPVAVSDNVWNSYTAGPNAYCPYETEAGLNFVQEAGSPTVWLVGPGTGGSPGTKRHVGSLCVPDPYTTQLKEYHVWTVPAGETAGHVQGADWWADGAKCQALPKG